MTPIPLARAASEALSAYRNVAGTGGAGAPGDFAALLGRAMQGAVATGHEAETQAASALAGNGDLTHVVTAVSRAELALQTTVALRDRMVQAYQDIMHMAI